MTQRKDLTRWNRAGRSRFDYVDGNAVEFLEILRQQLVRQFADPATGLCDWLSPPQQIPANEAEQKQETLVQREQRLSMKNQRLLETYHQDRRDWAWEISRSFARSCHMLTEHANAYANEAFLGTATQWDHVRRLVEMLDYHPAPPASASTWLSFNAREGKSGVIPRGFQVKNSPPAGSDKVIFETLEDVFIDAALNELRPRNWDKSEQPLHEPETSSESTTASSTPLAEVMQEPAIHLQGIGTVQAGKLDSLVDGDGFKIKDFLTLDPDSVGLDINKTSLWEWKAKANFLYQFAPAGDWTEIAEMSLPEIAASSAETLAEQSGNTLEMASALKQEIEMVEVCLDHQRFLELKYKQLVIIQPTEKSFVKTSWYVPTKPAVEPGEVAMIMDDENDRAEAVTINRVEQVDGEPPLLELDLRVSLLQNSWGQWARGNTLLHYSPRWHKKCWLNGANVIRTREAHGLSVDAYVGWKRHDIWQYARVIEADKRNLRLDYAGPMPIEDTELFQLSPIHGPQAAANLEVIVLLGDEADGSGDIENAVVNVPPEIKPSPFDSIFTINDEVVKTIGGGGLLPPASLPKIGSFLFPTPFLPMDLVKAAVELLLNLGVMVIPSTGEIVIKGLPFEGDLEGILDEADPGNTLFDLLDAMVAVDSDGNPTMEKLIKWDESFSTQAEIEDALEEMLRKAESEPLPLFQQIKEEIEQSGPLLAISKDASSIATVDKSDPLYMFDSYPDRIQAGDWIVAGFSDGLTALQISGIEKFVDDDKAESFALSFDKLPTAPGELSRVHADFRGELIPHNATINLSPIDPENFELEHVPENLKIGRQVLITGCGEPYLVKITDIDGDRISFDPPLAECLAGKLVIQGNVVLSGHGETQPQKIIGSGNAAKSNQAFVLGVPGVSFTPDATKSAGVAAAIEVEVAGRVWEQVSSLKDSVSDDHHYEVRMTEDGYVKMIFGDGSNGRRLPSGKNNLRVRYRVGSGVAGNVPAGSLIKAVKPNPLIDAVAQPMPASGGGDMEDQSSLRENAPPTLLALKRAVSLSDFSHLAAAQSSIWQARAYSELLHGGRLAQVTVIVVPAGGVFSVDIKNELQAYLQKQSLPGVKVSVEPYQPQTVNLKVTIRIDSAAFIPQDIAAAVEAELIRHFALQNRGLGEPLYLSEVYKVVENIEGVENSICVLNMDARVVRAADRSSVVHLDIDAGSSLTITTEEYRP
jgi:hypothetical protein